MIGFNSGRYDLNLIKKYIAYNAVGRRCFLQQLISARSRDLILHPSTDVLGDFTVFCHPTRYNVTINWCADAIIPFLQQCIVVSPCVLSSCDWMEPYRHPHVTLTTTSKHI